MTKFFYALVFFTLFSVGAEAQNFLDLAGYSFSSKESYVKAEPQVLEAATYLYTTPIASDNLNRLIASQFILKWMEGTEYTFNVDSKMTDLTEGSTDLFGMYLAGMAKVVLENKETPLADAVIHEQVTQMLVDYCKDPAHHAKPNKKLKKLMK